jgi:putative transposase
MREIGLAARRGRRPRPRTTDSRHDLPVAPNLLARDFAAVRPDTVWLADISYLPTDEGWLYLAAIKDMATREIVGWSMADHLRAGLCVDALVMALQRCRPSEGLIHHSDRGVRYASGPYCQVLERHGIQPSMSRRGNCLGRVGDWRGGFSLPVGLRRRFRFAPRNPAWHGSVSSRRSSNRTCGSPASGSRSRLQAFALGRSTHARGSSYRPRVW